MPGDSTNTGRLPPGLLHGGYDPARLIAGISTRQVRMDDILTRHRGVERCGGEHIAFDQTGVGGGVGDPARVAREERHFAVAVAGKGIDDVACNGFSSGGADMGTVP